ncbi:MAG: amino acid adenylation domain-containing protein [Coleofasciculus sp. B1-GNL1-01]|uniref:amino acid adenylation domain-containing protein n=1 Tax=Coleofasciculus sp. B1-GNL1-01 TaxID=3068484 RepID=UPI0032F1FB11
MKPIDEFLSCFQSLDVRFWVDGEQLHYNAPEGTLTPTLKSQLRERKSEIIEFLKKTDFASSFSIKPILPVPRDTDLPLSFAQQRLWFLNQLEGSSATYNIPGAVRLSGNLDVNALQQALSEIVRRHEVLRTSFQTVNGTPIQVIHSEATLKINVVDLEPLEVTERETVLHQQAQQEAITPFNLEIAPLIRCSLLQLSATESVVLLTMHHIISDGWSMGVFIQELSSLYQAFGAGEPSPLAELPIQYADFAIWQRQWLSGEVLEAQLNYWLSQLQGAPELLQLPTDHPRPTVQTYRGTTHSFTLNTDLTQKLQTLSRESGTTLFMTLLAAFATLLYRYSGQSDILMGSPIANRHRREIESLIGFFVNTLVLRTRFEDNPRIKDLLAQVRETTLKAYEHQDVPFEQVVEALQPQRSLSHSPLFQVMFILQNAPMGEVELPGVTLTPLERESTIAQFDLTLSMTETTQGLVGEWEYNTDLFDGSTIERMTAHFQNLLSAIVENPQQTVAELPLLSEAERHQLLVKWNETESEYPLEKCIHQLFEKQVERTPDAVAVVFEEQQLTYRELNVRANQLAHHLQKLGVKPEVLVGICVERSLEMVVGLLGILKAGGAYLPVDPAYPQERQRFLLSDSQVSVLLTQEALVARLPDLKSSVVCLDADWTLIAQESRKNPVSHTRPENLAYAIYTSGSTGKPKGVMIQHQSLVNYTQAAMAEYAISSSDRILQFASISFDAAAEEIFPCLARGAMLVLRTDEMLSSIPAFLRCCDDWQLTVLDLPTAFWHQMVAELPALNLTLPDCVRLVIIGGEKALPKRLTTWQQQVDRRVRLVNTYGLTEATIVTTAVDLSDLTDVDISGQELPIGKAISHAKTYILDPYLQPVPVGVPGELYIGGVGVARGYLNRPELTALAFIPDPFSETPGARLYKTGDRVRYRTDGTIEFLGRLDRLVKVRGFRIELREIESFLNTHSQIQQAVVIAREDLPGNKRLVAYIVTRDESLTTKQLREFLFLKLPEYMVPNAFVTLDTLPLTPNGKVDRKALPAPDLTRSEEEETFVAPRTTVEKVLAEIWAKVLRLEKIGVHDNFFDLGGDSILSIQIVARANQTGLNLTIKQMFEHQTIAELAAVAATNRVIQAQQGLVTGKVPITPIQHWFFEQNLPESHHWNQSILLEVRQALDPALLEQTVQKLLEHHDALRLCFVHQETDWQQLEVNPDELTPFTLLDLSTVSETERGLAISKAATELQASLNLSSGPLVRVAYFNLGANKPDRLLLVIHHLAVDGVSWRILLEDLQSAYQQLSQGKEIQLSPKTTSFKYWAERLREYAQSEALQQELDYWLRESRRQIAHIPVDFPEGDNTVAKARNVSVALSKEETQALLQEVPAAYQTQINDVLLTALVQAFAQWTGVYSLLIDLEGHGREEIFDDVDLSRTVGWFTTIFPVLLDIEESASPGDALKTIKEQLRSIPNRGIGYGVLRYLKGEETTSWQHQPQAEIAFNYLGQTDQVFQESSLFVPAREPSGQALSLRGSRSHLLDINGIVAGGQLRLDWTYSEAIHQRATIENLAQSFIEALRSLIAHCQSPEVGGYPPSNFQTTKVLQKDFEQSIKRVSRNGKLPLSFAQQRLWFLEQLDSGSYNELDAVSLVGLLNVAALEQAFNEIVRRHEVFRTTFPVVEGQPIQRIAPSLDISLSVVNLCQLPEAEQKSEVQRLANEWSQKLFDLAQDPLLRVKLLKLNEQEHVLLFSTNHIIFDRWSMGVLITELATLYEAFSQGQPSPLPELPIQYTDFAVWQRQWLQGEVLENQLSYWRQQLAGAPATLNLQKIADPPPLTTRKQESVAQSFLISTHLSQQLKTLSRKQRVTLFMTLLAAFQTLLYRYTNQDDIIVGTDVAGRHRAEIEPLIGFFINLLLLRSDLSGNPTFRELLKRVQEVCLGAYAHQDLPFAKLVESLRPDRATSKTPLFQVLFVLQNTPMPAVEFSGLTLTSIEVNSDKARFDLALFMQDTEQGIVGNWKYRTDLFEAEAITRLSAHFQTLLHSIAQHPDTRINTLEMLSESEKQQQIAETNQREKAQFKKFKTIKPKTVSLPQKELIKTDYLQPGQNLPYVIQPDGDDIDLADWATNKREFIETNLLQHGAILFRGFNVKSVPEFEKVASAICPKLFGEYGDLPREGISGRVYGSTPYPSNQAILFHNESSHMHQWPLKIWFFCVQPAHQGGETPIVDCRKVYQRLNPKLRERFKQKQLMYVRNYIEGLDVSWQDFFHTTDKIAVENYCRQSGIDFEWLSGNSLRIRKVRPAISQHPKTGESLFFNQVQLHHISCLEPAIKASLLSTLGEENLPRNVYYGDGSPIEDSVMAEIGEVYQEAKVSFPWQQGDILMLDNMLIAHGRNPYVGSRKIVVAMGEMISSKNI